MSVFRSDLSITEFSGPRFELALDLLHSGQGFVASGIKVSLEDGTLRAYVPASWKPEQVTEARAREDLARGSALLTSLRSSSQRFEEIAGGTEPELWLIADYGTGWVPICRLIDGDLVWESGYPKALS